YDTYASCLAAMGYQPDAQSLQRFYATGVNITLTAGAVSTGAVACGTAVGGSSMFQAGRVVQGGGATQTSVTGGILGSSIFQMAASGIISNTPNVDLWVMNQNKLLIHGSVGF